MNYRLISLFVSVALLGFIGCSDSDDIDPSPLQQISPEEYTFVRFQPTTGSPGDIPLPNDILRSPVTGNVALPLSGDPVVDALISQVNTMRGFSTSGMIRIPFTGKINATSANGQTILLVDLATQQPKAVNISVADDETGNHSVVYMYPRVPLEPGHPHVVIVTQGVTGTPTNLPVESDSVTILTKRSTSLVDGAGNSLSPALDNATARALEPLRGAYQQIWGAAEAVTGLNRLQIPLAYAFTTQPLFETLHVLRERAQQEPVEVTPQLSFVGDFAVNLIIGQFEGALGVTIPHENVGGMYFSTLRMPFYLSDPVAGPFAAEGEALQPVSHFNVPFFASLPKGDGPFPTLIFQHGITTQKEFLVGLANAANGLGIAVIGIDLIDHGDLAPDLINNTTGAPEPDGVADPSGRNFINLTNLLMSRDNLRQSVANLYMLTHMIASGLGDLDQNGTVDLLPQGITFSGQSLGAIVGGTFLATEPNVRIGNINVGGGRVPSLLVNSDTFGPAVNGGLASFGLAPGTVLYDLFLLFAQTVVDDGDPINYAPHMFSGNLSGGVGNTILMQEMIGDGVVPNSATRDLALAMGINQVAGFQAVDGLNQVAAPHGGSGYYQFPEGGHGALIDPRTGPTTAIQTQLFTFLGSSLQGNPTIIDPLAAAAVQLKSSGGIGVDYLCKPIDAETLNIFPR